MRISDDERTYLSLGLLDLVDLLLDVVLDILDDLGDAVFLAGLVREDTAALDDTDDGEEEVDGSKEVVLGSDNEAPAGPDGAGGRQGRVLGQGKLVGGTGKVSNACEDKRPLS